FEHDACLPPRLIAPRLTRPAGLGRHSPDSAADERHCLVFGRPSQQAPPAAVYHGQGTARPSSKVAISLFGGRYRLLFLRQRHGRGFDRVEPGAIVPQDLAPGLAAQWQAEELLDRLREGTVGVRIVRRHHEIFGADLVDDIYRRLLVDIERDVALALEVLARQHRQLTLAAGAAVL